ncbi:MAG: efflux RND transporter periplasmic adaptor subunit [Chitinophagaceae bacterium]|nr:efflux RND transporter periplasmic adaptor subunit [Chitinophagaceae bacterium]NBY25249.1 efflux RND transporter periplasmic adaptor subunit [Chitinophagaceae bacterium]NCW87316.1 efflux RND transporter periplasmic adaptor subunit [Chitinophagia bacterium]NDB53169.1 efflux RND transporter periplasmic adaptor subunit [Chitinophagaceae bacterium]NDE78135.1 efflux RND transporter periplasmic adaptor subunit [Chitinophagaceae bacterium]
MNTFKKLSTLLLPVFLLVACGGNTGKNGDVAQLRQQIEKIKKEKTALEATLRDLEQQLELADPSAAKTALLVSVDTLQKGAFAHYIDLQGRVEAEDMAYVAPSGMGGLVKAVYVKTGQRVTKGQTLLKLDDAVARQQLAAAQQQTGMLKARVEQAQTILQRYENLWKQNIGAEISVVNARADVEALNAQLRAAQAQVAMAQEQVNMTNVKAEISGVIEEVNVKVGELFSAQAAATPGMGIRIVNNSRLKVVTNIPENYIGRVNKGAKVEIQVLEATSTPFTASLSVVGESINAATRSFNAEAIIPANPSIKPNQTANVRILDYKVDSTVTVPLNTVQRDEKGRYVYVVEQKGNRMIARKMSVITGEAYGGRIEIKAGLNNGQLLISRGFQNVYDGQVVKAVQ